MTSVAHTAVFEVARPLEEVFPLFSPEGERLWVPGWDYRAVSDGVDLHEDYVFLTSSHDHASADAIWLVKRHDPADHHVAFYKVEPGEKVGIVTVCCSAPDAARTRVEVTYEYVALSESGEGFVEAFTAEAYECFIGEWQTLLERYFAPAG